MLRLSKGFTLIEVMVTIAVAAILLGIGVPSLISVYEGVRVNNNIEKINNIFLFARNQAISYGTTVNVCAFASATSCGTDWGNGIRVYITRADSSEKELRVIDNFNPNDRLKGSSSTFSFSPDGLSSSATLIYCPGGKSSLSKSVSVSVSGLVSYGEDGKSC
ncbi:prepilin-type N-terminal cleavage/methylation domain-containing protein [Shewanella canadensis]|uniref:Type II secretion system protein H n=1 Tax=Shewanella canadensis TaxID=271096 RepID=A0A3S0KAB4_9GAMM|nr:GspH/FimT family pseudopilin [Shewanella canadensis]RTR39094.1 prepilin-type N-terminal cleavage/methylation domain-containing protein [Shewanella canadensis]